MGTALTIQVSITSSNQEFKLWHLTAPAASSSITANNIPVYNFTVDWGDGSSDSTVYTNDNITKAVHTYSAKGYYDIIINGSFEYVGAYNYGNGLYAYSGEEAETAGMVLKLAYSGDASEDSGGGDTGDKWGPKTARRLYTWQYAAREAYIVVYYKMDTGYIAFEIWNPETHERMDNGDLVIYGNIELQELCMYSVNDVVYIAHETVFPTQLKREVDDDGNVTFYIEDMNIPYHPVLSEYANRNKFTVDNVMDTSSTTGISRPYLKGETLIVEEEELTEEQIANGAEPMFVAGKSAWRSGQMLLLKHRTEQMKTWGLLYSGTSNVSVLATPAPDETYQNSYGGRNTDLENTVYEEEVLPGDWCSEWLFISGSVTVETTGKWSGKVIIDLWNPDMRVNATSGEPEEWEVCATIDVHNAMSNKSITRDFNEPGNKIRIRCVRREKAQSVDVHYRGSEGNTLTYTTVDNDTGLYITASYATDAPAYVMIKNVYDGYAECEALHQFYGGWTSCSFAEGAWSPTHYGYPRTVCVFQERMVFAGNAVKPCTIWCSKTDDWTNFVQGSESTSPIFGTANTDNIDAIQWLLPTKSYMMFGSLSGEWYFGGANGASVKPSEYTFQRLSKYGSTAGVKAVLFGNATIVVKSGGKEVMDVSYNTLSETGEGTNLSLYAEHLFENDPIIALQSTISPKMMLWALTESGRLCSFTYEQQNNVFAWARQEIHDAVLGITSFRREERDVLAMLVQHGNCVMLGEIDPTRGTDYDAKSEDLDDNEHIFQDETEDDGFVNYESRVIPTPISVPISEKDTGTYGHRVGFKDFDVYLKTHNGDFDGSVVADGTQFSVRLAPSEKKSTTYVCDAGFLETNEHRNFGENRVHLKMASGWVDYALVDIKTDYPAPLTITALGADFQTGDRV